MVTKRNIKNEVEDLKPNDGNDGTAPIVFAMTHVGHWEDGHEPTIEDSPHPELTVKPWPDRKPNSLKIAIPNVIPEPWYSQQSLFVCNCETANKYRLDPEEDDGGTVAACDLWNVLSEEQLRRDKAIRENNGEPIPEILAEI